MLADAPAADPLAAVVRKVRERARNLWRPDLRLTVSSDIPIASGLGSGAAITVAIIRALQHHLDLPYLVTLDEISNLTFEIEKIYHGTPSGIDNTVITWAEPIFFQRTKRGNSAAVFGSKKSLDLLIGDTGVRCSTKVVVSDVRRQWEADKVRFERIFDGCGAIAEDARTAIADGDLARCGALMNENHLLLQEMTVSSPELDRLVTAAQEAGALGAKLSGGGRGGT